MCEYNLLYLTRMGIYSCVISVPRFLRLKHWSSLLDSPITILKHFLVMNVRASDQSSLRCYCVQVYTCNDICHNKQTYTTFEQYNGDVI